jgi:hypothetical protein
MKTGFLGLFAAFFASFAVKSFGNSIPVKS